MCTDQTNLRVLMWHNNRRWTLLLWKGDNLKLKCLNDVYVSYKHESFHASQDANRLLQSGDDYLWIIVMFLSAVWTHSDGTHSLQRIHCWAGDVMLNWSKSVLMKKQTHLHLGWPEAKYIFNKVSFLMHYFFKTTLEMYFKSNSA